METTTRWTTDDISELIDLAEDGKCNKDCPNCPIFLHERNECWTVANKKWKEWAKKEHQRFQKFMKEYKG